MLKSQTLIGFRIRVEPRERLEYPLSVFTGSETNDYFSFAPVTILLSELNIENIGPA